MAPKEFGRAIAIKLRSQRFEIGIEVYLERLDVNMVRQESDRLEILVRQILFRSLQIACQLQHHN